MQTLLEEEEDGRPEEGAAAASAAGGVDSSPQDPVLRHNLTLKSPKFRVFGPKKPEKDSVSNNLLRLLLFFLKVTVVRGS